MDMFYWNTADDKEHTHQRMEWAIEHGYMICINIKIDRKLLDCIKPGCIILTYEPKFHHKSKDLEGSDGYCMHCKYDRNDGKQAFTAAFRVISECLIANNLDDEHELFDNWLSDSKHLTNLETYNKYFTEYYNMGKKKYIIPVEFIRYLDNPISTNSNTIGYYYNKPVVKGFNKLYCGCDTIECTNMYNCITSHINF
jgi:hypothetical protein